MNDFTVLVTGGAGNLGRVVTRTFLEAGARVAIPYYKTDVPSSLDELRGAYGERLHTFALDLTTERGAEQVVQQVMDWSKRLDIVAHLVGGYTGGSRIADTSLEAWERMIDLNLKSAFLISRFVIPVMVQRGRGSLVFVSSRAALRDRGGHAAYAVSKAALITLVEAIAEEYRDQGIRANAVIPGTIDTEANRRANPDADFTTWTRPEEIAHVIRYLGSPESEPVNGAAIPVFGRS